MARIKGFGGGLERAVARRLRVHHAPRWVEHKPLLGSNRPDFAWPGIRVALFADGCFWHRCPKHRRKPKTNVAYWVAKDAFGKKKKIQIRHLARKMDWVVIRIWEHSIADFNWDWLCFVLRFVTAALTKTTKNQKMSLLREAFPNNGKRGHDLLA